jgi:hypothetical protein
MLPANLQKNQTLTVSPNWGEKNMTKCFRNFAYTAFSVLCAVTAYGQAFDTGQIAIINGAQGLDTVAEIQVLTANYSAEYGRASSGVVRLVDQKWNVGVSWKADRKSSEFEARRQHLVAQRKREQSNHRIVRARRQQGRKPHDAGVAAVRILRPRRGKGVRGLGFP